MTRPLVAATLAAALAVSPAMAAEPLGCLIQPFHEAEVGSQVVGIIDRVLVERGEFVKKGQPIAQLNADVERAAVAAARLRADANAELQAAASSHDFAQKKKVRTQDLYRQNFVSQQVRDQADTEAEVAEMRLRQAREQARHARQELALAQAQLDQRTIRSPLSGVVVERYLHDGERVEEKPVVKVATIDPLRVEVIVPSMYFNRVSQGMSGKVLPEMAQAAPLAAKVVVVDRVIDAASNSFRVRLELPNPDGQLPPGLRCKVELDGLQSVAQAPAKPLPQPSAVKPAPVRPAAVKPAVANQSSPKAVRTQP